MAHLAKLCYLHLWSGSQRNSRYKKRPALIPFRLIFHSPCAGTVYWFFPLFKQGEQNNSGEANYGENWGWFNFSRISESLCPFLSPLAKWELSSVVLCVGFGKYQKGCDFPNFSASFNVSGSFWCSVSGRNIIARVPMKKHTMKIMYG